MARFALAVILGLLTVFVGDAVQSLEAVLDLEL
jgi:hypothetical protein